MTAKQREEWLQIKRPKREGSQQVKEVVAKIEKKKRAQKSEENGQKIKRNEGIK